MLLFDILNKDGSMSNFEHGILKLILSTYLYLILLIPVIFSFLLFCLWMPVL